MKKLGVVLVLSSMLLSGCTATNGILTSQDVTNVDKDQLEQLVKNQRNVYTTSKSVQEAVDRINAINIQDSEDYRGHMDGNRISSEHSIFEVEGWISENSNDDYFKKCVDILDETVASGIKKYINNFSKEDILEKGPQSVVMGRTAVYSFVDRYPEDKVEGNGYFVNVKVNLGDIKDKTYAKLIDNVRSKDFILQDIQLGKHQDFIKISNVPYINNFGSRIKEEPTRTSYELFLDNDNKEIKKAKLMIVKEKGKNIKESDMYPLKNISSVMKFDTKDLKTLEDITININKDAMNTKKMSTENFNFVYKATKLSDRYDEELKEYNTIEIIIEKK